MTGNFDFIDQNYFNKVFFFRDFDIFDGSIECTAKFHDDEIKTFFSLC